MTGQQSLPLGEATPDLSRYRCGPCGSKRLEHLHRGSAKCTNCCAGLSVPTESGVR